MSPMTEHAAGHEPPPEHHESMPLFEEHESVASPQPAQRPTAAPSADPSPPALRPVPTAMRSPGEHRNEDRTAPRPVESAAPFSAETASSLLRNLNPEQLAAVTLPAQPALILAGAGSG